MTKLIGRYRDLNESALVAVHCDAAQCVWDGNFALCNDHSFDAEAMKNALQDMNEAARELSLRGWEVRYDRFNVPHLTMKAFPNAPQHG